MARTRRITCGQRGKGCRWFAAAPGGGQVELRCNQPGQHARACASWTAGAAGGAAQVARPIGLGPFHPGKLARLAKTPAGLGIQRGGKPGAACRWVRRPPPRRCAAGHGAEAVVLGKRGIEPPHAAKPIGQRHLGDGHRVSVSNRFGRQQPAGLQVLQGRYAHGFKQAPQVPVATPRRSASGCGALARRSGHPAGAGRAAPANARHLVWTRSPAGTTSGLHRRQGLKPALSAWPPAQRSGSSRAWCAHGADRAAVDAVEVTPVKNARQTVHRAHKAM